MRHFKKQNACRHDGHSFLLVIVSFFEMPHVFLSMTPHGYLVMFPHEYPANTCQVSHV